MGTPRHRRDIPCPPHSTTSKGAPLPVQAAQNEAHASKHRGEDGENHAGFPFVLARQGKNSSQGNKHHRELAELSTEQPAPLESSKHLGNDGKQQPLRPALVRTGQSPQFSTFPLCQNHCGPGLAVVGRLSVPLQKAAPPFSNPVSNGATAPHGSTTSSAASLVGLAVKEPPGKNRRNVSQQKHRC